MKANTIGRVLDIFEKKDWELDEDMVTSKFNLFCKMLERLENENEVDLMIELLEDFLHVDGNKYNDEIAEVLKCLLKTHSKLQTLFVLPLISENDAGKIKSSHSVLYKFKGTTIKYKVSALKNIRLSVLDDIQKLPPLKENQMLILVDDFIGTGDTAIESIDYLTKIHPSIEINKIAIFTIVIQKKGLEYLEGKGFEVFYSNLVYRGVSDKYPAGQKEIKLALMKNIEDRLTKLKPEYRYGYKQSEGLVCMERTPNNTFPIFWHDYKSKYNPPFPR